MASGGRRLDPDQIHQSPSGCFAYYDDAVSATVVYLDICALKRPFDDSTNERIRREAGAVARIFEKVESGSIQLVISPAHRFENDRNPREDRRLATALWLQKADRSVAAAAFAEKAEARWFITTDDRLLKRALAAPGF